MAAAGVELQMSRQAQAAVLWDESRKADISTLDVTAACAAVALSRGHGYRSGGPKKGGRKKNEDWF